MTYPTIDPALPLAERRAQWADGLDRFTQGKRKLQTYAGHCCLGAAAEMSGVECRRDDEGRLTGETLGDVPTAVSDLIGVDPDGGLEALLVVVNDRGVGFGLVQAIIRQLGASTDRVDLRGADLTDADLAGADLAGADLTDADLTDADLTDADLTNANLPSANLRGANLRGANLRGADLTDADLRGADLTDANLTDADLHGAELTDADLRGATR